MTKATPSEPPPSGTEAPSHAETETADPELPERRDFMSRASSVAMSAGLTAAYGGLGLIGVRYLFPPGKRQTAWVYVMDLASFKAGSSMPFRTPSGERVTVARTGSSGEAADFVALSSTCPHLGCQVHWEGAQKRFFCPCHNGTFDAAGKATGGPPAEAGQSLPRYPLKVESGLLYMEVAVETLSNDNSRRSG